MTLGIIGLGLIGGSMAIDAIKYGYAMEVLGVENNSDHAMKALELGLVDKIVSLSEAIEKSDLIVIAVAADATMKILPQVLDAINEEQVVIDVCSIKRAVNNTVENHERRGNFVATHPMAGTEHSGPHAAINGLFKDKVVVFVDENKSKPAAVKRAQELYQKLNMRIITMDADEHDMHTAYVSHISHLSSMALALTVLAKEENEKNIFDLASGGFESTVRLAKSTSSMWTSIFTENADNVLVVLDEYIKQLSHFKTAIASSDKQAVRDLINEGNKINKII